MRADEHDVAQPARDQADAPEDGGAQDQLAQRRVGLHQGAQPGRVELEQLGVLARPSTDQAAPAGEEARLAAELPGALDGDGDLSRPSFGRTISMLPARTT